MKGKIFGIIIILILIFGGLYLAGYVNLFQGASIEQFNNLKEEYGFERNFSSDLEILNDYINELSLMRTNSIGNLALTIDLELAHAYSLYYLSKALEEEKLILYSSKNCNKSLAFKNTVAFLDLTIASAEKGIAVYDLIIDKSNLRQNQLQLLHGYADSSKQMKKEILNDC